MTTETPKLPTADEIVARIKEISADDFFGFETNDLLIYLPYEEAKSFIKEDITEEKWKELFRPLDRAVLLKKMEKYMDFAWDKAKNCRGLSAMRSINHYAAWTFLAGDKALSDELHGHYEFYGKDRLVQICKHYGWDPERWDDHIRVNSKTEAS